MKKRTKGTEGTIFVATKFFGSQLVVVNLYVNYMDELSKRKGEHRE